MERYIPKNKKEAINPVVGNLYLATSIKDLLDSRTQRIEDAEELQDKARPFALRARLALADLLSGFPFFVYMHDAKHGSDDKLKRGKITIFDDNGECLVEIPQGFNRRKRLELRGIWESNIILLSSYDVERRRDVFRFDRFVGEVKNPRQDLGAILLHPH